jgi:hypothetical protein
MMLNKASAAQTSPDDEAAEEQEHEQDEGGDQQEDQAQEPEETPGEGDPRATRARLARLGPRHLLRLVGTAAVGTRSADLGEQLLERSPRQCIGFDRIL